VSRRSSTNWTGSWTTPTWWVKAKFLRSARGGSETAELAEELAAAAGADLYETRGNTAVFRR